MSKIPTYFSNFYTTCSYMSTWFVLDICSTAPLEPISLLFTTYDSELGFKLLNMLRLWRLRRVSSLFARFASMLYLISWFCFHQFFYLLEYFSAFFLTCTFALFQTRKGHSLQLLLGQVYKAHCCKPLNLINSPTSYTISRHIQELNFLFQNFSGNLVCSALCRML